MKEYAKRADDIIADLALKGKRESMLLHSCCGPCSTACIDYLSKVFDLTVFFYNPNISRTMRSAPLTMAVRTSMLKMTCPTYW